MIKSLIIGLVTLLDILKEGCIIFPPVGGSSCTMSVRGFVSKILLTNNIHSLIISRSAGCDKYFGSIRGASFGSVDLMCTVPREKGCSSTMTPPT